MRLAFDLDNTIICYDRAFAQAAVERGFLPGAAVGYTKRQVREALENEGAGGVRCWQELQGFIYGRGIARAELFPGVNSALAAFSAAGHKLCIISHKTQFGHFDDTQTDLRDAARAFLTNRGVVAHIAPRNIQFCETLAEKIAAIAQSQCEVFVDDLTDVLLHENFPPQVRRILFRGDTQACERAESWSEIQRVVLGTSD